MIFNLEPVKRDKTGKLIADYSYRDFYEKIGEELMKAHEEAVWTVFFANEIGDGSRLQEEAHYEILELLDLMTAVATRINALADEHGFSDDDLAEMQGYIVEHNRKRGYFDEP